MGIGKRTQHENRQMMARLNHDARQIAIYFGLRYRSIDAERANVKSRYGICYDDGTIRIRLRHSVSGEPLKYSSLVNTLCHELAHLRYFDHSERFRRFYQRLLAFARVEGIYRPANRSPMRPLLRPMPTASASSRPELGIPTQRGAFAGSRAPAPLLRPRGEPTVARPSAAAASSGPEQLSLFG